MSKGGRTREARHHAWVGCSGDYGKEYAVDVDPLEVARQALESGDVDERLMTADLAEERGEWEFACWLRLTTAPGDGDAHVYAPDGMLRVRLEDGVSWYWSRVTGGWCAVPDRPGPPPREVRAALESAAGAAVARALTGQGLR
jgi:hypothetical protein